MSSALHFLLFVSLSLKLKVISTDFCFQHVFSMCLTLSEVASHPPTHPQKSSASAKVYIFLT